MTQEPTGKTGLAAGAENCLVLIAHAEGMIQLPRRSAWPLPEDERAALLTEDVLRRLASLSDGRLLAQRLFSQDYLEDFRTRFPRESALLERVQVSRADGACFEGDGKAQAGPGGPTSGPGTQEFCPCADGVEAGPA